MFRKISIIITLTLLVIFFQNCQEFESQNITDTLEASDSSPFTEPEPSTPPDVVTPGETEPKVLSLLLVNKQNPSERIKLIENIELDASKLTGTNYYVEATVNEQTVLVSFEVIPLQTKPINIVNEELSPPFTSKDFNLAPGNGYKVVVIGYEDSKKAGKYSLPFNLNFTVKKMDPNDIDLLSGFNLIGAVNNQLKIYSGAAVGKYLSNSILSLGAKVLVNKDGNSVNFNIGTESLPEGEVTVLGKFTFKNGSETKTIEKNIEFIVNNKVIEKKWTWNVLNGPVPEGAKRAVGDGKVNDGPAIQSILDKAKKGDVIYFPSVAVGYRVESGTILKVPDNNLTLLGDGWVSGGPPTYKNQVPGTFSNSKIIRTELSPKGSMIQVTSNAIIDGLYLDGNDYGPRGYKISGVHAIGGNNITVRNMMIEGFRDAGIHVVRSQDVLIKNSFLRRNTYGGIILTRVKRAQTMDVGVVHTGDPERGQPYINSYPFAIGTSVGDPDLPEDVLALRIFIDHNPQWAALHNHGCNRFLVFQSAVKNSRFGIEGHTEYPTMEEHHVIDSIAENIKQGMAIGGTTSHGKVSLIGNRVFGTGTAPIRIWSVPDSVTVTWNETTESHGYELRDRSPKSWLSAHNTQNGKAPIWKLNGSVTPKNNIIKAKPPEPKNLISLKVNNDTLLTWDFTKGLNHDSFYIEHSYDGIIWKRVAYTPPNNGLWDFKMPTNLQSSPYNPLMYKVDGVSSGKFRIRANNGDAFSGWTASN